MALMSFATAHAHVLAAAEAARLQHEIVNASEAYARVLAADIRAPFAVPGFDHAAMDGFAIANPLQKTPAELQVDVVGQVLAGDPPFRAIVPGEAVQIATGAVVPLGTTRVVPVENSERLADTRVRLRIAENAATHIRGADDDYRADQLALTASTRLDFAALGALASFGLRTVMVSALPRVSVIVTGSELVPAGVTRAPGRIHDSNGAVLRGLLRAEGVSCVSAGPLPDDADRWRQALLQACAGSDLVITTGGASAGQADFMPALLAELGEVLVWKVAMRPGMPFLFARIGSTLVFGLPGNPVSVVAGFLALVRPALRLMQGMAAPAATYARLHQALEKSHDRLEFRRGLFGVRRDGVAEVRAHPALSSGVLRSVVETNALIVLDAERRQWQTDDVVEVLCYSCI